MKYLRFISFHSNSDAASICFFFLFQEIAAHPKFTVDGFSRFDLLQGKLGKYSFMHFKCQVNTYCIARENICRLFFFRQLLVSSRLFLPHFDTKTARKMHSRRPGLHAQIRGNISLPVLEVRRVDWCSHRRPTPDDQW